MSRAARIAALSPPERRLFGADWWFAAHEGQTPPEADWTTWLVLGGRGGGKTRAGAEWVANRARDQGGPIALVGQSLHDVREVMIEGPSGLRALPRYAIGGRPWWEASRRRLVWPNGAVAMAFSAEDPESLRGPQFGAAWADEWCAWRRPEPTLALLRMGLRLGTRPRLVVTTTPKPTAALRRLLKEPGLERSDLPTRVNAAHLAPAFLEGLEALYGGTRLAAQELDGKVVEGDGALFTMEMIGKARAGGEAPDRFERVVVAVDPPCSAGGDACGIVVVGRKDGVAHVLADRTVHGRSPQGWAGVVARAVVEFGAVGVVAEANQGGEMVEAVLKAAGIGCPVKRVHARFDKRTRAEPVAALYEQRRVMHAPGLEALEEELMGLGVLGGGSPDRADALVWAVTDLLINGGGMGPSVRVL
ncbi:MAG: terminase family protein [Phenylobacterium sp.]|uniref:DNA-packaging protein n=1 Tax=Brevundimonas sp. TaxID=1871086 RepID=UPI0027377E52|nr:terminase family protein [Brevundimonas sp.]MDP3800603.1 terminase family protein [Brevundimonas sp.]MDZ4372502.1 terminase family protein [Phenylobacterium sp.]